MEQFPITTNDFNYLMFIIPGFVVVWTYRFFVKPKPIGEFEYAGLSFLWGVILFLIGMELNQILNVNIENASVYSFALIFSFYGIILGWLGGFVARWKWLKACIDFFRPRQR